METAKLTRVQLISLMAASLFKEDNRHEENSNIEHAIGLAIRILDAAEAKWQFVGK